MSWKSTGLAGVVGAALLASGCATNPATGERELSFIGEQQEIQMGQEADQQIQTSFGAYDDAELQQYVQSLGARLAAASERPDLPWTFRVLDDPTVNAFALPGGFVYVTRGILTHLRSEAELAGVLGHEIAHITARHSVNQISKAQLTQLGFGLGMILVPELRPFGDLASAGMQLLFLKYSRDDESQADELGLRYMTRLDYDPRELADAMRMLARSSEIQGGSGRVPEWMASHPDPGNRAARIESLVQMEPGVDLSGALVRSEPYLQRIDGTVFGDNPREGFFEDDNLFRHPDLEFRIAFPRGWNAVNTKQAVQAMSPEQDAALELTLTEGTPSQALNRFASQQGIQMGRSSQETVHGLRGVVSEFGVATEQGAFVGVIMFVSHGGHTYQIMGYAPEARWSRNASDIEQALFSFQEETDPRVLGARPDRLDIVRGDRALSFQAFLQRYPSDAEPEVLALINGLEGGASLPAGSLVKRVVDGT